MTKEKNKQKSTLLKRIYKGRKAYLFILPMFLLLFTFSYFPAFSGLYHAFFDWDAVGTAKFIGFANFKEALSDEIFLSSFGTMFKLLIPRLIITVIVPLIIAELIYGIKSQKAKYFYRVAFLLPMVAPGVVGALIWKNIYDPNNGLLVEICRLLGIVAKDAAVDWLGNPDLVIFAVIFQGFPWVGGSSVLIYLAGLNSISTEIIESAVLDGASRWKRFWHLDMPLLMGQVRYFLIFGLIAGLQDYSTQILLTDGGPGFSTMVPGYYMFTKAFKAGRMGYASAVGMMLFVIILVVTVVLNKYTKTKD